MVVIRFLKISIELCTCNNCYPSNNNNLSISESAGVPYENLSGRSQYCSHALTVIENVAEGSRTAEDNFSDRF